MSSTNGEISFCSERQPLLTAQAPRQPPEKDSYAKGSRFKIWPTFTTISPRYRYVPLLGCLIVFINESEYFFKQVAVLRAIEAMYCVEFYSTRDPALAQLGKHIPERLCKDHLIQKQLAKTAGLIMFFRMIAAMVGAIPLGQVADTRGRKVVLVMHKVNVVVSNTLWLGIYLLYPFLPIWTLYFTGVAGLFGGNFDLGLAMLFASYSDVVPSVSERAALFFLTTSMQYVAQALIPPIGGWLMNLDGKGGTAEVAMLVSFATSVLAALVTIFLFPETLDKSRLGKSSQGDLEPSAEEDPLLGAREDTRPGGASIAGNSRLNKIWEGLRMGVSGAGLGNILLLATSIFCATIGIKATDWYGLIQYPVIKLGWTFSRASTVVSAQAVVILLNFALLLPAYNRLGTKHFGSATYASFAIMTGSSVVLCCGSVLVGLSSSSAVFLIGMVVYTLGEGMPVATQAYIASIIDKGYLARVMAMLSMASAGGKAIASAVFPQVLAIGLDTHIKELVGLPFFVASGLYLAAGGCVLLVGLRMRRPSEVAAPSPDPEHDERMDR